MSEIKIKQRRIADLIGAEYNPRELTDKQYNDLADSIKRFGLVDPVLVNINKDRKNIIIGGHQRTKVAKDLGFDKVPVVELDLTLEQERELNVRLNKNSGQWDMDMLQEHFNTDELIEWGFEDADFGDWEEEVTQLEAEEDDFEVPDEIKTDIVQGDLIEIGEHRLLCGDSTSVDDVERLMDGIEPDLIHTDPPYGMNAVSKSGVLSKNYSSDIMGDDNPDVAKDSFNLIYSLYPDVKQCWWGANYYSSCLPDSECWLVWDKNNGGSDQTDAELAWANYRSVVRMFTKASEKTNRVHPTQKPVELVQWVVDKSKEEVNIIADFFGGSGVTMVWANQKNCKALLMEFDPKYCQVIVDRMMKLDPKLEVKINGKEYKKEVNNG